MTELRQTKEILESSSPLYLYVNQVPRQRVQHLKLSAFDVKAEVIHLGAAQRQQQARHC